MEKVRKKIGCFSLACFLIISNFMIAKAEALPDVMSGSTTLADNIMSYYAMSGSAVANTDWINTLYDSYGSSFGTIEELANQGYLVLNDSGVWEPTQQLGQMIAEAPAYSSLELNQMFNISAEEVANGGGYAAASGASVLAGSLGGVATNGVIPLFGGVTAAYWGGIALGTLCNHLIDRYKNNIAKNANIMASQTALQNVPAGGKLLYGSNILQGTKQNIYYCCQSGLYGVGYLSNDTFYAYIFNADLESRSYKLINRNNPNGRDYNVSLNGFNRVGGFPLGHSGWITVADEESARAYAEGVRNGSIDRPKNYSPDIIGEDGNQEVETENGGITVPNIKPMVDPGTQAGKPLTLQDWLNFANGVNNNNSKTDPFGDNSKLFKDILDLIAPYNVVNPDPEPDPWSPPVVTPVPDPSYPDPVPDQPTSENPDESENPQETEPLSPVDTGKPWMLPDLTKKFPFCIPWDIKDCFTLLKSNIRQAPHITWRFNPPNTPIDYTFNLDLSDFEPVAILLRTLELIAFIAGLAFATRYLIGAS